MNQNPNYPPGPNPNNPGGNYGTSYGSNYPGSGPNPNTDPNPYSPNPYPQNPPSGPNPNTNPNPYNPYPQNPGTNPYDPYATAASQGTYPGYNPYTPIPPAAPPAPPLPPTRPRSGPFSARVLILIGLALLIIVGGIAVLFGVVIPYQTTQTNNAHATATAQARTAATAQAQAIATSVSSTATVSANATATVVASHYPFSSALVLNDPLFDNSHGNKWDEGSNGGGTCQFTQGAYHVSESKAGFFYECFAETPNFSNFTFEVKMKIIKGDSGGLLFRADQTNSKFYYLSVGQDGSFDLSRYVDNNGNHAQTLRSGSISSAISGYYTGLNQTNIIGVVARGSSIELYANGQRFAGVTDSMFSHGQIGLTADSTNNPTEVAFSDAMVWNLGS